MTIDIAEFRRYLKIDKLALDDEVVQQPSLFYEVSSAQADAGAERDARKEELATIDADLDIRIRHFVEKATEGSIRNQIQAHQEHQTAFAEYLTAKERADKLTALKEAFQQRSYMLRDLVTLHNANYFEETSVRATASQDKAVYTRQRAKLAEGRAAQSGKVAK